MNKTLLIIFLVIFPILSRGEEPENQKTEVKKGNSEYKTEYVEIQKRDLSVYEFELDAENKAEILVETKIVLKKTDTKEILNRLKTFFDKLKPCFTNNPSEFKINFDSNGEIKDTEFPENAGESFKKCIGAKIKLHKKRLQLLEPEITAEYSLRIRSGITEK